MTSDRDQLAELIHDTVYSGAQRVTWEAIADAILAAGWRPCNGRHWIEASEDGFDW
jgi:hypothetical protein